MALELIGDIAGRPRKVALVNRGHEVTPRPADSTRDAPIGAGRGHRFREAHEIAQADIGSKADDEVHVICQHGSSEYPYAGGLAGARHGTPHVARGSRIDTPDSLPGVPGYVSVHLISVVVGHRG